MRILIVGVDPSPLGRISASIDSLTGVSVVNSTSNAVEAVRALRHDEPDIALYTTDAIDFARIVKRQLSSEDVHTPPHAAAVEASSPATELKALRAGLDGVVEIGGDDQATRRDCDLLIRGSWAPRFNIELDRSLLSPPPVLDLASDDERELVDLIATGLTDAEISVALGWTVQTTRNMVSAILARNDLTHRTLLAISTIAHRDYPDLLTP